MKNVLQDQNFTMHIKSDLYNTFEEKRSKKGISCKIRCIRHILTIFGAIWYRIFSRERKEYFGQLKFAGG